VAGPVAPADASARRSASLCSSSASSPSGWRESRAGGAGAGRACYAAAAAVSVPCDRQTLLSPLCMYAYIAGEITR
jgi:hypothetical protein